MSGELNVSSSSNSYKCTFKNTLYSESSMRLKLGETGDVTTESALFPFPQWAYRAWSNIGQRLLGRNSISQNNLEIQLKSIIIKNSSTSQPINRQSSIDSFTKAEVNFDKLGTDGKITIKEMIELQVELLMMQTHFEEYLANDKGKNSKVMLENILDKLNLQLSGSGITDKAKRENHLANIVATFVEVLKDFHKEIFSKVTNCSLSRNDYLKYMALTNKNFECCHLKGYLQEMIDKIRDPLSKLYKDKELKSYIELPELLKTKFDNMHHNSIIYLNGDEPFPKSNIFSKLSRIPPSNEEIEAKRRMSQSSI